MLVMMESVTLASYLLCFCLCSLVLTAGTSSFLHPVSGLVFANVGDNMTLQCSCQGESLTAFHWYKQTLTEKPSSISTMYKHDPNILVSKEFQNNHRFSVNFIQDSYRLTITNLSISDSGTYYCLGSSLYVFQFDKIYIVHVTSLHLNASVDVHRSPSQSNQSGDSVTLNCTVHTGTCDEEHIVYWFRTSGESEPELIYAHEARNDHCENKNNTCFYNLSMNMAKPGIYYCAVAACGRILFGGGNKLDAEGKNSGRSQMELVYSQKGRNNQCEKKTNTCVYSLFVKNVKISRTAIYYCAVAACGRIAFGGGNGTRLQFE
ncbi:unnamed protein product, partial [Tetraodon nigroviridis]